MKRVFAIFGFALAGIAAALWLTVLVGNRSHFIQIPPSVNYPNEKDYTRTTRVEAILLKIFSDKAGLRRVKEALLRSNTRNVFANDSDEAQVAEFPAIQRICLEIERRRIELGKTSGFENKLASCLTLIGLASLAGCKAPHAMAEFAAGLNHAQRRHLRCWSRPGRPREYDVPGERTFRRLLKQVDPEELKAVLVRWMEQEDPTPPQVIHADGKVIKNAEPAPARPAALAAQAVEPCEIPEHLQKPNADKALTLVNFQTTDQRLLDQIAVPRDTNEEAAVAAHLPKMDLAGVCLTTDAAHLTKANCRQLTQNNGADFFIFLKGNQPTARAKAEQLLPGKLPPSGQHAG